jgi:hypothetical protein
LLVAHVARRRAAIFLAACCAVLFAAAPQAHAATCSQAYLPDPDPSCQPGAINPDVTQSSIDDTICVSGWTATVRPPTSYTNALKAQQIGEYGYADTALSDYEEDHLIPLELGGPARPAEPLARAALRGGRLHGRRQGHRREPPQARGLRGRHDPGRRALVDRQRLARRAVAGAGTDAARPYVAAPRCAVASAQQLAL